MGNRLSKGKVHVGGLTVGGQDLSAAEMAFVNGVTAGTVTASKAVVVDSNKDVGTLRHVTINGNLVSGSTTLSETDLAKIDGITNGTAAASKALVADANGAVDVLRTASLRIGASGSEVTLGSTPAEIDGMCDVSAYTQAITSAGAVTADGTKKYVTLSGGAYAITLAAPGAGAVGKLLVITYIGGDTDAVTLVDTNILGASGSGTFTFDADRETLVLLGLADKWLVLKEQGVTIA